MFEEKITEFSEKLGGKEKTEFVVLTNPRNKREILFRNNKKSIKFISKKFSGFSRRIAYLLIKLGLLQPLLKKVSLNEKLGDVILVGGQIKSFDLDKGEVLSFPTYARPKEFFLKSKKFQSVVSEKGFAPEISEINEEIPYSREELLREYSGNNFAGPFKKILSFYKIEGIKKVSYAEYLNRLKSGIKKEWPRDSFLQGTLSGLPAKGPTLLITKIHGDFSRKQILIKNDSYVFIDWEPSEDLIVSDLANFFGREEDLLKNGEFLKLLALYPIEVQKNIRIYLILNQLSDTIKNKGEENIQISKKRIKILLGSN